MDILLNAPMEHMESVYDDIDWNLAGNASTATTISRVSMTRDCISPLGTVIPRRGATLHLPMRILTVASASPVLQTTYSRAHTATSELSQKPTNRGLPTAFLGRVVLGKVASPDDSSTANQLAHFCFS